MSQFVRTANRYLEVQYNGLPFTLTHFFENILKFVRQTSIIAMVSLRFHRKSFSSVWIRGTTHVLPLVCILWLLMICCYYMKLLLFHLIDFLKFWLISKRDMFLRLSVCATDKDTRVFSLYRFNDHLFIRKSANR